jgi:hypothetical protein
MTKLPDEKPRRTKDVAFSSSRGRQSSNSLTRGGNRKNTQKPNGGKTATEAEQIAKQSCPSQKTKKTTHQNNVQSKSDGRKR